MDRSFFYIPKFFFEEEDLVFHFGVCPHVVVHEFRGVQYGGMAPVDGFGDGFDRFIRIPAAQIHIDVSGVGVEFFS